MSTEFRCFFFLVFFAALTIPTAVLILTIQYAAQGRPLVDFGKARGYFRSDFEYFRAGELISSYFRRYGFKALDNGTYLRLPTTAKDNGTAIKISTKSELQMEVMFAERRKKAAEQCRRFYSQQPIKDPYLANFRNTDTFHFIHIDEKRKLLFCSVPKVGSTNWRRFFIQLGSEDHHLPSLDDETIHEGNATWPYLKSLASYDNSTDAPLHRRIKHYKKIIWVRDPLQRLVSAWLSKLVSPNPYYQKIYTGYIIERFRYNTRNMTAHVTLEEFFRFISSTMARLPDVHWDPIHKHCLTCFLEYDYIGHLENGNGEANYVIRKTTGQSKYLLPAAMMPQHSDRYISLLQSVPRHVLEQVFARYEVDLRIFGYV